MVKRRKVLAGLGSMAAGSAALMGTGAFTQISASRGVKVSLAGDANALLGLRSDSSKNRNAEYVEYESDDTLSINISGTNSNLAAEGINDDAVTIIRDMFDIVNQGPNPVFVWQETNGDDGDNDANDANPIPFGLFADYPDNVEPADHGHAGGGVQPSSGPSEPTLGLGEGETGADALSSEEGNNMGSSIPERNLVRPGHAMRELGTFFFGIDPADFPINGEITLMAQDINSFEGSVSFINSYTVEVDDPTP